MLGATALALEIAVSGRTRPPEQARADAVRAFEAVKGGLGAAWAPDETRAAAEALRAALFEYSRQQNRPFVLRDFRPVSPLLDRARSEAVAAGNAASERRDAAKAAAESAVAAAQELEGHALALVAVGYRSLSVAPSAIGPVKAMLLELRAGEASKLMSTLIDSPAGSVPIRDRLKAFAEQNGLQL